MAQKTMNSATFGQVGHPLAFEGRFITVIFTFFCAFFGAAGRFIPAALGFDFAFVLGVAFLDALGSLARAWCLRRSPRKNVKHPCVFIFSLMSGIEQQRIYQNQCSMEKKNLSSIINNQQSIINDIHHDKYHDHDHYRGHNHHHHHHHHPYGKTNDSISGHQRLK